MQNILSLVQSLGNPLCYPEQMPSFCSTQQYQDICRAQSVLKVGISYSSFGQYINRISFGRLPKAILFGQLAIGTRSKGRPMLRYKDVCKTDLKSCNLDPEKLHALTSDRNK